MAIKFSLANKLLALLISIAAVAGCQDNQECAPTRMEMPVSGYEFSKDLTSATVPFKLINNAIVVQLELNGKTLNLLLDTGMPIEGAILYGSSKIDSANLSFSAKIPVGGMGGNAVQSDISMGATIMLPDLKLTNQMIIVMPNDPVLRLRFENIDGIIGFSFFANFVVEIDYEKQQIILTKPEAFDPVGKGQKIPIEIRDNRIFVKSQIELEDKTSIPAELVVDIGNSSALILNTKYRKELVPPKTFIPIYARGLNKKFDLKAGRVSSFTIGDFTFTNVLSSFNDYAEIESPPWEKEGNLGNEIFKRFKVTFDILGKQIYLEKNKMFSDPFEYNMAGFQYERSKDGNYVVTEVIPNSPAEKNGILQGDKIISINNKLTSQSIKDEIESELKKLGNKVSIVIERSGKKIEVKLTLTRLI
jgi:hypothetical protein